MRFLFGELAYGSSDIYVIAIFQNRYITQILPFTSDRCSPHYRSYHFINRSRRYKYISDLDTLLHHFLHWCIMHSNLSFNYNPFHSYILQREVFIQAQTSCSHTHDMHNEIGSIIYTEVYAVLYGIRRVYTRHQ